ncbi:protein trapped in endoderm-1 [Biomphalaria glabrata]|nr:protein trapped in endoderm-1-like [Biomphalaria glabrata]
MCSTNESFVMAEELRIFHVATSMTLGFLGTLGNSVSIYLIIKNQLYRNCTMLMIIDLCIANLVSTLFILPMIAASNLYKQWVFGDGACRGFAYVMYVVITAECLLLMHITVSQYLAIKHNVKYEPCQMTATIFLLVCMPWAISLAIYTVPLLHAWDDFGYDPKRGYCTMVNIKGERSFHSVLSIIFISIISLVTIYCYASIYYVHFKSQKRTLTTVKEASTRFRGQARNTQLIKMITVILINYSVTYIPFLIMSIIDPCVQLTPVFLYTMVIYISWSHTATNPVIYALMNTKINAVWRKFLSCDTSRNKVDIQNVPVTEYQPDTLAQQSYDINSKPIQCVIVHGIQSNSEYTL